MVELVEPGAHPQPWVAKRCVACSTQRIRFFTDRPALARIFSAPNLLTWIRLPMAALLWLRPTDATWLLSIITAAALSDAVDGRVAKLLRRGWTSDRAREDQAVGAWLDPVCDKAFAVSALCAITFGYGAPFAAMAMAVTREVLMVPLIGLYHLVPQVSETLNLDFSSDWTGKLTTVLQFGVIGAVLLVPTATWPLAIATAIVGAGATVHYVRRGIIRARDAARYPDLRGEAR